MAKMTANAPTTRPQPNAKTSNSQIGKSAIWTMPWRTKLPPPERKYAIPVPSNARPRTIIARSHCGSRRAAGSLDITRTVNPSSLMYGTASRSCRSSVSSSIIGFTLSIRRPRRQCAFQLFAASQNVRFDRAKRNVKDTRGFIVRQTVLAAKHNCGAFM
jgi:hypothetical protein